MESKELKELFQSGKALKFKVSLSGGGTKVVYCWIDEMEKEEDYVSIHFHFQNSRKDDYKLTDKGFEKTYSIDNTVWYDYSIENETFEQNSLYSDQFTRLIDKNLEYFMDFAISCMECKGLL